MPNPLILKLQHGVRLTDEDCRRLQKASAHTREIGPRQDIIREGDAPDNVHLVMDGVACRSKITSSGKRTIMALLLAGDFCDLHVAILGEMDHTIATLTHCTMVQISRQSILEMINEHPRIAQALWWATLVDEGVLREWLVNLGQRQAEQRMAHLFCELLIRLQAVGLAEEDGFDLRLTQEELADVLALTSVHVNRTIRSLREKGLATFNEGHVAIRNVEELKAFADFRPSYLHLTRQVGSNSRGDV